MASRRGRRRCCMTRRTTNACSAAGGSKRRSRRTSSRNRLHFLPRFRILLRKQGRRVMVNMVLRGAVLLWAAFFAIVGARGLLDPASYTATFGFTTCGAALKDLKSVLSGKRDVVRVVPGCFRIIKN